MCSGAGEATGTLDDCPSTGITLRALTMSYDHADRMDELTQVIDTPGEAAPVSRTQSLDYREDSTLSSSSWDGHTTTYEHSQGGFLTQMSDWRSGAEPSTMAYLASGATTSATLAASPPSPSPNHPDGSVASLSWEASGMGSPVREHEDITYNAAGLRTSEQVAIEAAGAGDDTGGPASFDYDLAGRLTSWTSPFSLEFGELDGPDSPTTSYRLDDAGNITRQEVTTQGRAEPWEVVTAEFTNARLDHRRVVADSTVEVTGGLGDQTLTATTDQDFDYSALGEETGRDATTSYAVTGDTDYDPAGTTRAQRHSGTVDDKPTDPTYFYDASGQVIARKTDQKATYLFYFAGSSRLAEEAKPDGTTRTRFLNAPSGKVVAEQRVEDDQWVWLLSDPDGNVATELQETTGDPTVKRQRAYDPYGSPDEGGTTDEPLTGPESKSSLGYQSDNTDEDTGNLLLGPRLYDPEVNRFTSPDVFAAAGADMALGTDPLTGNRFMFAAANPVAYYEDGHEPCLSDCNRMYSGTKEQQRERGARTSTSTASQSSENDEIGYHYTYTGVQGDPRYVAEFVRWNCSSLFPIQGCKDGFEEGARLDLLKPLLVYDQSFPVVVTSVTDDSFSFEALDGHPEGAGRRIQFTFGEDASGGSVLDVRASGPGSSLTDVWGLRALNRATAFRTWGQFADSINAHLIWQREYGA